MGIDRKFYITEFPTNQDSKVFGFSNMKLELEELHFLHDTHAAKGIANFLSAHH